MFNDWYECWVIEINCLKNLIMGFNFNKDFWTWTLIALKTIKRAKDLGKTFFSWKKIDAKKFEMVLTYYPP